MSDFSIRPLQPDDKNAWTEMWRAYLTFYETERPDEVFESTWARLMTAGEDPAGLCAVDGDGQLVGLVHYIYHRSCWTLSPVCYLQDLFADPAVRGSGVGRALIEAVYAAADESGAASVYWLTQDFNANARKLYDRVAKVTPLIKYVR